MDLKTVIEIAGTIIISFGGVGGILCAVVKFTSDNIAERLQMKYQVVLDKDLEAYKTKLGNKQYISRARFDKEFEIYQGLSSAFFDLVRDISEIAPRGLVHVIANPEEKKKSDERKYKVACDAAFSAQNILNRNAAFIPVEMYNAYREIMRLVNVQLFDFEERWNVGNLVSQKDKETVTLEMYKRTTEINDQLENTNKLVREYLVKLEVLE